MTPTAAPPPPGADVPAALRHAVDGYLAHLSVERGLSANTLAAYRRDLHRYLRHLAGTGRTEPMQVTEADVEAFLVAARTGTDGGAPLAASSAARAVIAVRGWHRFLAAEGTTAADPARDVRPPARPQRLPVALSVDSW